MSPFIFMQSSKAPASIFSNVSGKTIGPYNEVLVLKASPPIYFNLFGSNKLHVKSQLKKARKEISSNVFGNDNVPVIPLQYAKASRPIFVTPSGIFKEPVIFTHLLNAPSSIQVSLSGSTRNNKELLLLMAFAGITPNLSSSSSGCSF